MTINLVALIMQFLTPDRVGRIASALGLDRSNVQTAVGAAVPGLLAGLNNVATQPGGAQKLADAAKQQTGTLANFTNTLGGSGQSLVDKGSQLLSSLLGGRDQTALAGAVGKFSGVGQSAGNSLLGMLTPVVMGAIAEQQGGKTPDAGSITNLFADQKDSIAAALPSGFKNLLGGTGLLSSLGGAGKMATAVGNETAQVAASAARAVGGAGERAAGAASSVAWIYWLIPILAIAAMIFYVFVRPTEEAAERGAPAMQSVAVGGVSVGKQVSDSIGSLLATLGGVTDAASAQAALPKLREVTAQIDKVDGLVGQMSPDQRKVVAGVVNPVMPKLNELFDKVLAIPGVADLLKPTIDTLKGKLAALTA